jgi:hypothetical protein
LPVDGSKGVIDEGVQHISAAWVDADQPRPVQVKLRPWLARQGLLEGHFLLVARASGLSGSTAASLSLLPEEYGGGDAVGLEAPEAEVAVDSRHALNRSTLICGRSSRLLSS